MQKKAVDSLVAYIKQEKISPNEEETAELINFPNMVCLLLSNAPKGKAEEGKEKIRKAFPDFHAELKKLFKSGKHSDATLRVSGTNIPVHKAILGAQWNFFSSILLKSVTKDGATGEEIIPIDSRMPSESFRRLLSYFYGRKFSPTDLSPVDAHWILSFSEYYDLKFCPNLAPLLKISEKVISKKIPPGDALSVLQLSFEIGSTEFEKKASDALKEKSASELVGIIVEMMKKTHGEKNTH